MAVIFMLGFDGFAAGSVTTPSVGGSYDQWDLYGYNYYRYNGKELPIMYMPSAGSINGLVSIGTAFTPNQMIMRYDNNSASATWFMSVPVTDESFDDARTGKWYMHCMPIAGGYGTTNKYASIPYKDADGVDKELSASQSFANSGPVYVEVIIDWELKTVGIYKAGALVIEDTFSAITGDIKIGYLTRVATTKGGWSCLNNFYFVIDKADDPNPTGRLGPCKVKAAPFTEYATQGEFSTISGKEPLAVLNTLPTGVFNADGLVADSRGKAVDISINDPIADKAFAACLRVQGFMKPNSPAVRKIGVRYGDEEFLTEVLAQDKLLPGVIEIFETDQDGTLLRDSNISKLHGISLYSKT